MKLDELIFAGEANRALENLCLKTKTMSREEAEVYRKTQQFLHKRIDVLREELLNEMNGRNW